MILKQGHTYEPMPHDGKVIRRIYRGGRCYYIANPYSPEATQALKAAFPQYWTAIRDYGVAHPQLVPFVNEDPMLIVSLVEVGKTRWLKSDKYARIQTSVVTTLQTSAELHFMTGSITGALMGGNNWSSNSWLTQYSSNTIRWHWASAVLNPPIAANTEYHATFAANYINLNGVERTGSGASKVGEMVELFYCKNSGCDSSIAKATFKEGDQIVGEYVPYLTPDGTCGMLDIVSLTFYPNANTQGAFTIQVTDKAT